MLLNIVDINKESVVELVKLGSIHKRIMFFKLLEFSITADKNLIQSVNLNVIMVMKTYKFV